MSFEVNFTKSYRAIFMLEEKEGESFIFKKKMRKCRLRGEGEKR